MFRNFVITAVSVVAFAAAANAADMYRAPDGGGGYKDGPAYVAVNWSGFYAGAHIGGAWGDMKTTDVLGFGLPTGESFHNRPTDVFGGGQLGYNFQRDRFVFGVEADFGDMPLSKTSIELTTPFSTASSKIDSSFYADVTGRLGFTVDRALIYAKGGYAYLDGTIGYSSVGPTVGGFNFAGSKSGLSGWTAGAGVEYKINPSWSVKAEYLHFDFGSETITISEAATGVTGGVKLQNTLEVDTVKAGVNYFLFPTYEPLK